MTNQLHEALLGFSVKPTFEKNLMNQLVEDSLLVKKRSRISSLYRGKEGDIYFVAKVLTGTPLEELVTQVGLFYESHIDNTEVNLKQALVLAFDDCTRMTRELTIPHPDLVGKAEFLRCASEVWAEYYHPVLSQSLLEITIEQKNFDSEIVFVCQSKNVVDI